MEKLEPQVELLATVGAALSNWSFVELQMSTMFDTISDMRNPTKGRALFDGVISFDVRLSMLDRMMEFEELDDPHRAIWQGLRARMAKFYKKRHEVAHFSLVADEKGARIAPFATWGALGTKTQKELSCAQIRERADKFDEIVRALHWFVNYLKWARAKGLLPRELIETEPPLIARIRALGNPTPPNA